MKRKILASVCGWAVALTALALGTEAGGMADIGTLGGSHRERFENGLATLRFTVPTAARGKPVKVRLTIKLAANRQPARPRSTSASAPSRNVAPETGSWFRPRA
jgi:hypothetical protein